MRKIKIGQIGTGHFHAEAKLAAVRKFPEVFEVVGIAEANPDNWARYGNQKTYRDLPRLDPEDLLAWPGLDAVLVETNEWDLVPVAQQCIDAGVHIHLDKPGSENLTAYARLLETAKQRNLTVQLGYMYRYNPAIQYCYEAASSGLLGDLFEIDAIMSTEHTREVRQYLTHFRGGTMFIFGCHLIDLVISLMGKPERIVPFQKRTQIDGVDLADNGLAVFEYTNGTATIRTTSVEVKGYERRQLVLCGSKGTIEIKPLECPTVMTLAMTNHIDGPVAYMHDNHVQRQTIPLPELTGRYDDQLLDFAGMVRGERVNPFTYEHEFLVQQATLQACGMDLV
jgi:predicted dehydrogenase